MTKRHVSGRRANQLPVSWHFPSVLSRWFAVSRNRHRPMIGMPTHSQHPRRDRPRRHKRIDVSQSRCIMVSSRKHHRSVAVPTGPGQGSCRQSRPLPGDGGTRSGTEEVVAGGGPAGGVRSGVFRVLGPPRACPAGWSADPGYLITNPGIRTPGGPPQASIKGWYLSSSGTMTSAGAWGRPIMTRETPSASHSFHFSGSAGAI